ncbi:MAG: TonB-dependent receptor [Phycisphaerales bacterium]
MLVPRVCTRWWLASLGVLTVAFLPTRVVAQSATLTGTITDSRSGGPIAAARVSVAGSPTTAVSSARGTYRLAVVPGQLIVRIVAIGFGSRTDTLTVAAGETRTLDVQLERSPINLQEIAVIGTRDEGRTVVSSPVPVDVLTAEDIKMSGRTETAQILQMLAPSFNFPRPSVTDGTDHSRPATLRGLAPDQVLVLVNGKRRHTSALINLNGSIGRGAGMVDLNAIPASAIERVEILRDGAAAQYGSDAIAGVINIVLKGSTANQFSIQGGEHRTTMPEPEPETTLTGDVIAIVRDWHMAGAIRLSIVFL